MTQEEKAKAHDEALRKIRPLYERAKKEDCPIWSTYEYIFPELAESEDEKIRKEIISALKFANDGGVYDKHIAYLEKQKEQSITANDLDEEIHRFFDDCIDVHEAKLYGNISESVISVDCYELTARHFAKWGEKQKEQKSVEWSEEDDKLLNKVEVFLDGYCDFLENESSRFIPEVREVRETISRLKALRTQYHGDVTMTEAYKMGLEAGKASSWKPSEEQMNHLKRCFSHGHTIGLPNQHVLKSLFNDLKKL